MIQYFHSHKHFEAPKTDKINIENNDNECELDQFSVPQQTDRNSKFCTIKILIITFWCSERIHFISHSKYRYDSELCQIKSLSDLNENLIMKTTYDRWFHTQWDPLPPIIRLILKISQVSIYYFSYVWIYVLQYHTKIN